MTKYQHKSHLPSSKNILDPMDGRCFSPFNKSLGNSTHLAVIFISPKLKEGRCTIPSGLWYAISNL